MVTPGGPLFLSYETWLDDVTTLANCCHIAVCEGATDSSDEKDELYVALGDSFLCCTVNIARPAYLRADPPRAGFDQK